MRATWLLPAKHRARVRRRATAVPALATLSTTTLAAGTAVPWKVSTTCRVALHGVPPRRTRRSRTVSARRAPSHALASDAHDSFKRSKRSHLGDKPHDRGSLEEESVPDVRRLR